MTTSHPRRARDANTRDAAHLRRLNLDRVLGVAMERRGPFTRAEVVEATGLSTPTVGSIASQLVRAGLIHDRGAGPSSGGRRPMFMEFNEKHGFVGGIDLGPTHTRLAVADLLGEPVAHRVIATPTDAPPAELISRVAAELRALLRQAKAPAGRLLAVVAGAPGTVDRDRGMVLALAPNLQGWSEVPMRAILTRALRTQVVVENDVNLAVLGERWRGAARGHDTCAFITVGKGIGAGILMNGALHHGHHYLAGEIGLMCMGPQYVATDFGSRGCLESLAGIRTLAARWPGPPGSDATAWIGSLVDAAGNGDSLASETLNDAATLLGMATANLSLVLDPSLVVLGGALFFEGRPLVDAVRHVVDRLVPTPPRIVLSDLQDEAPLWGCLLVATEEARERVRQQLRAAGAGRKATNVTGRDA